VAESRIQFARFSRAADNTSLDNAAEPRISLCSFLFCDGVMFFTSFNFAEESRILLRSLLHWSHGISLREFALRLGCFQHVLKDRKLESFRGASLWFLISILDGVAVLSFGFPAKLVQNQTMVLGAGRKQN